MGNSVSRVVGCFVPVPHDRDRVAVFFSEPLDEGLGHSFCYIRPPLEFPPLSPSHSDRYAANVLPPDSDVRSSSFRSGTIHRNPAKAAAFKSISGASVSANTSTPRTILSHEQFHSFTNVPDDRHAAFESTASFTSLPLQPVPRGVTFSGPISATFSGPISGPLQERSFMSGPVDQQQRGHMSGPLERGFMSGPLERGFMSGPLERGYMSGPIDTTTADRSHFSAPLTGPYHYKRTRRRRIFSRLFSSVGKPVKGALSRTISSTLARTRRSLVTPVRQFVWRHLHNGAKEAAILYDSPSELRYASSDADPIENHNLQWAQGKAGEDRVHVVVSEDHGWLFVGIYDGFNGPDAPDFLMRNLYRAVYKELQGLLWDMKEGSDQSKLSDENDEGSLLVVVHSPENGEPNVHTERGESDSRHSEGCSSRPTKNGNLRHSRTLKDYLNSTDDEVNNSTSGSGMKYESQKSPMPQPVNKRENMDASPQEAMNFENSQQERLTCNHSIDGRSTTGSQADPGADERASDSRSGMEALGTEDMNSIGMDLNHSRPERVSTAWSGKSFMRPTLRHKQIKNKESHRKFLPRRYDSLNEWKESQKEDSRQGELKLWMQGAVEHDAVLRALARALEVTEEAYLDMADHALEENPELALMGSCILVALMKDKDVYILNVGDSRAIVAQQRSSAKYEHHLLCSSNADNAKRSGARDVARQDLERILEESPTATEVSRLATSVGPPASSTSLNALQLSTDHSTSIEEEVCRIKAEHPDDNMCILNDRVKGRLKVTRAFGAGFLKQPRWNSAILKMFQIDYVGSAPYVSCVPALHHHRLGPDDRFLILSSDGLYQYFSNQEVVSYVEWFMEKFPEGDPAQHLIEELLFRAAKKAGMDFHELLDIPQGDRRKYHDDVSVMVISIDGRIWRSSG